MNASRVVVAVYTERQSRHSRSGSALSSLVTGLRGHAGGPGTESTRRPATLVSVPLARYRTRTRSPPRTGPSTGRAGW